jgi:general secretion pathway protein M
MKAWWLNLGAREKQTLIIGGICIGLFFLYELTWAPLANKVDHLRNQIRTDKTLVVWMQANDKRIQALSQAAHNAAPRTTASLLNIVQTEINKTPLAKNIAQLQQAENDAVELRLQKVDFDNLIAWLTQMSQEQELIISQALITASTTPGIVDADLRLE